MRCLLQIMGLFAWLVLCIPSSSLAQRASSSGNDVVLIAELEPDRAYVDSPIVYKVVVQGAPQNPGRPTPPAMQPAWGISPPNFVGTESSQSIFIGPSGRQSIEGTVTYRYAITPSKEGTFTLPAATLEVNGQRYESNSVNLVVSKLPAASNVPAQLKGLVAPVLIPRNPALQAKLTGAIFVLPVVTNPNPYNGEQVRVSFHLVVDAEALAREGLQVQGATIANPQPPSMNEFLKEELYVLQENRPYRKQMIGGKEYNVLPLYEAAITSTKTGKLTMEPFKLTMLLRSQDRRRGRSSQFPDPFDDDFDAFFGMSPFGGLSREELVVQSLPVEINVKPLPREGKPANFSGAVGEFRITSTTDRDKAAANDDIVKYQVVIEGKGDTSSIPAPTLPNLPNVSVLGDPKSTNQGRKENDEYISTRKFEYQLRPTQPGKLEIPPIELSVFNPKEAEYFNLQSNPVEVAVAAGTRPAPPVQSSAAATPAASGSGSAGNPAATPSAQQDVDLRYIHNGPLAVTGTGMFEMGRPGFVALMAMPPLVLLAGYLVGRRRGEGARETRSRRQKRALEIAQRHLRESEKLLQSQDRSQFFAELGRNLRTYFGNKFGIEAGSLTVGEIEEQLRASEISEETVSLAVRVLERSDAARYSPVQPEHEVARAAYNEAAELLNRVERGE